jgi:hypothetical protein
MLGKFFPISVEKVKKKCFPRNFPGIFCGKSLSAEKMYKKSAQGVNTS